MKTEELEELLRAATPLPWEARSQSGTYDRVIQGGTTSERRGWKVGEIRNIHDAALTVAAVNALPALLAERKRLREGMERLRGISQSHFQCADPQKDGSYCDLAPTIVGEIDALLAEQEATDEPA